MVDSTTATPPVAANMSTMIYLSVRYNCPSKYMGHPADRVYFEGRWAFTKEAAAAGLAAGSNPSMADQSSWPIQLSLDQQSHGGSVPPAGSYHGTFRTPEGEKIVENPVSLEFMPRHNTADTGDLAVSGQGQNPFGCFHIRGTYCIATRLMTCTKIYAAPAPAPTPPMKRPRPAFSKDQHASVSKKPAHSRSSYTRQQPVSFNIRAFMPLMKSFIKLLKGSNTPSDYSLAVHMEHYRPLNQQQQQRVFSMFIENQTAQREVASSGKSREENFTGFIRRYNLKSKTSKIPDSHFLRILEKLSQIKKRSKDSKELQTRVINELKKAAQSLGISSLSSYHLEYKERQQKLLSRKIAHPPFVEQTRQASRPTIGPGTIRLPPPPPMNTMPPYFPPQPFYAPAVDPNWKQHVNRNECIGKIWETLTKYQPKHTDLARRAENIEHDIIQRTTSEIKYRRAVDKWTQKFAAQAKKSEENKKNIDKQVKKLLNYYDSKRPMDGRLMGWDTEMNELKSLVARVKVEPHVSQLYRRMRDLFLKYQKAYIELKKSRPTVPHLPSPASRRPQFHPRTQLVPRPIGNMINPRPPSFAAVGAPSHPPTSFRSASVRASSYPPTSFTPVTGGIARIAASSVDTRNVATPYPPPMLNFSPKGAIVPMAHKGNTALEQPGYHPADTFPAAQFKKPRKMPPPPAPAGVNLNMPRTLPKPPMQAPMGTADSGTHKHIPGGPAATPSLTDPVTDPVPQIPVQNNAPPAEFDPSARPVEIEGGNALAPSMIPVGGNPRAPPMIPAAGNPLATPVIPTAEKPLAPPVIPATETTLTPPVIPAAGNQLAPPVIPAAENPLAPPVIPAASNAVATPTTPPPGNPLPPPVAMPAMNALTTPVIPADTSVDSQAEQKPPTVQAPSPPAAVPEEVAITMEGENIPPKPIVPKALSIDFPAGLEAFSPRIFDSTPTPVPDSKLQMSEQKMPAADTPNFEFPNSPGTGNFTPGPFEPFSFDVTAEAFALAGSASTPRDSEDDFGLKSCTPLLDNPPSSNNASN